MTLTLDRLEASGLVRRTRHPDDGRRVVIELTRRGLRVATAVNNALHEWEAALDLSIPAEHALLTLDGLTGAIETSPETTLGHATASP
jgi:DNA-binding MarR family transcriptional regulator